MNTLKDASGAVLSLLIAVISFMLSRLNPSFDSLVVSIIFGMLLSNMLARKEVLQKGIDIMLRFFLPSGIALYGTQLIIGDNVNYKIWLAVIAIFILLFTITFLIARIFRLSEKLAILLATGLAVCGASAIAVISPLIKARREDTSISLIVVMMIGLVSVVFYPILLDIADLNIKEFAFFSGTTIPMLGQVKVTVHSVGTDALNLAVKFKLVRVSMLIFLVAVMMVFSGRWSPGRDTIIPEGASSSKGQRSSIAPSTSYIQWFMAAFIILALAVNLIEGMAPISLAFEPVCKFFLSSALAAIGLSVDFDSVTSEGVKPLLAVFISWAIAVLLIYAGLRLLNV